MSFASNNSRNVANLLRFEPLEPLQAKRNLPTIANNNMPLSRERQQIPPEEVFTPEDVEKRSIRKKTPVAGNNGNTGNEQYLMRTNKDEELQLESFKVRLDQIIRYYDERHNNLESKMMIRLNELENFVMKEVPRIDNTTMLSTDILGFKEALKEVRRQQEYQLHQINTIKATNNDKNSTELIQQNNKQKEKSTVLFMEMVRLGDTVQKMTDHMNSTSRSYESKIQELQNKQNNSEKNIMIMSQRTSSGNEVLNELGDKLMARLQTSQSNLLILGKEQVKDKEAISRLLSQNERMGEDLQLLLRNMQTDFQSKLENRIGETVHRLMAEHEERIRSQEEIRKNLDLRERIQQEKQMSQKMENKARYDSMDALVRNQFERKEASIRQLHAAMETQFKNVMAEIQVEGNKRKEQEMLFRTEIKRLQESFRKEYDIYKDHQSELVQKITQMIKAEIQVRLSSQLDLKKLTSDIANELVTDLNNIKEALAASNKKLNFSIREVSNESSERSGQLSHYIDQEVKKVVEVVTEKYSKMKNVFTKLAEQLRNHLVGTENNRKNVQSRLNAIEEDFDKLKTEVNTEIDEFYNDLEARLKQEKEFVETVVFKKNNDLTLRVSKLEEYTNQYFELLKAGIDDNKDLLNNKLASIKEGKSPQNQAEMEKLRNIVFNIKNLTEAIKEENQDEFRLIKKEVGEIDGRNKENLQDVENKIQMRFTKNAQEMQKLEEQFNEMSVKVNSLRAEAGDPSNSISNDKLKKVQDQIENLQEKINNSDEKNRANDKDIEKINDQITVLKQEINVLEKKIGGGGE